MSTNNPDPSSMEKTSKIVGGSNPDSQEKDDHYKIEESDSPTGSVNGPKDIEPIDFSGNLSRDSTEQIKQLGPYKIERVLGQGGMGKVLLGEDIGLMRKSAIKVIAQHLAKSEDAQKRLEVEARAAARLNHQNIVQVYAFGEEGRHTYIAFEYIDGRDLDSIVKSQGKMDLLKVLDIARQAAKGLRFGYAQSVIHRDIKPANLMMLKDGTLKIADFGLAKELDKDYIQTRTDTIVGSPAYMSPEQGMGRTLDFRSDIYSLGATMFTLLTGRVPFIGDSALSVLLMHANEPLPEPPEIKKYLKGEVMGLINKMMAKRPEDRHASYDELIADIDALSEAQKKGGPPKTALYKSSIPTPTQSLAATRSISQTATPAKSSKMNLWLVIMGVAGLVLTIAVFVMIFSSDGNSGTTSSTNQRNVDRQPINQNTSAANAQATPEQMFELENTPTQVRPTDVVEADASEYISLISITPAERLQARRVASTIMQTEIQVYNTVGKNLPVTIKPPGEGNLTIESLNRSGIQVRLDNNTTETIMPPKFPSNYKAELAKWVSENTQGISDNERNLIDYFRFMNGDDRITKDYLLGKARTEADQQSLENGFRYRDVWQEFIPSPGPGPGNQGGARNQNTRPGPRQ